MTWVKVCGVSRHEDVEAAAEAGADAIGLVLIESSPRAVTAETAARLVSRSPIPAFVLTLDAIPASIVPLLAEIGASGVQPYGRHAEQAARDVLDDGGQVLRPIRVEGPVDLGSGPPGSTPLLDAHDGELLGGTGKAVDPTHLPPPGSRYVLAGGLGPDNVKAVVSAHRPWGVDASSGLESAPGVKDLERIASFVKRAKDA